MSREAFDVAIVGGGPAGQAAAEAIVSAGMSVVMLDEQAQMGGQILRQPPAQLRPRSWLSGRSYRRLKAQLARAEALRGLEWRGRTSVAGILPQSTGDGFDILTVPADGGAGECIDARRVLVAAGCYDLPVPIPGWTLPGTMSVGAIQAFVKSQQLVPGNRFVLNGTHPLQLVLADQIVRAGGTVAAVLFAQTQGAMMKVLATRAPTAIRHAGVLGDAAAAYARLVRARVPVRFGQRIVRIEGNARVEDVLVTKSSGSARIACDAVGLCFGFLPQADLPRSLGAATRWVPTTGGRATLVDAWQRTDRTGLYVAGETSGVAGAAAAMEEGAIAGIAIVMDAGRMEPDEAARKMDSVRARLTQSRRFADLLDTLADPRPFISDAADPDTIVCRCEDVTRGALEATLRGGAPPATASAIKLVTRAGMGLCQGRGCEATVLRIVAREHGRDLATLPGFTPRFPVRPVPVGSLRTGD